MRPFLALLNSAAPARYARNPRIMRRIPRNASPRRISQPPAHPTFMIAVCCPSGGKPMHTACTLCTPCTLFKTGQTTENKTLEFQSRKGGDGIRPFNLTGIRRESLKLGRKGSAFNI
jgi:hypothetical protein